MSPYRIYFLCEKGRIIGREDVEADDDVAAIRLARVLCDACSDVCTGSSCGKGNAYFACASRRISDRPRPI
jgi:hypothetical protein